NRPLTGTGKPKGRRDCRADRSQVARGSGTGLRTYARRAEGTGGRIGGANHSYGQRQGAYCRRSEAFNRGNREAAGRLRDCAHEQRRKTNSQIRREAKELFRLCLLNGLLDEGRVRRVVQTIIESGRRGSMALLSQFQRLVRLQCHRQTAEVESAVPL